MHKKKLIEVAIPLDAINAASAYEKLPGIGPHPRGLHLWWARRPLATCRAVLFASLVDDPSAHPDRFPTEADQDAERDRLFALIERLVRWENRSDEKLLDVVRAEIRESCGNQLPTVRDPFAGGGSIPLEAHRLGLPSDATDLNPVAVTINKALSEIPEAMAGLGPVSTGSVGSMFQPTGGLSGLIEDVRYYGKWVLGEARRKIGSMYPAAVVPGGGAAPVIAWLWARAVECPNPACGATAPLVTNHVLSSKKGKQRWLNRRWMAGRSATRLAVLRELLLRHQNSAEDRISAARCAGRRSPVGTSSNVEWRERSSRSSLRSSLRGIESGSTFPLRNVTLMLRSAPPRRGFRQVRRLSGSRAERATGTG